MNRRLILFILPTLICVGCFITSLYLTICPESWFARTQCHIINATITKDTTEQRWCLNMEYSPIGQDCVIEFEACGQLSRLNKTMGNSSIVDCYWIGDPCNSYITMVSSPIYVLMVALMIVFGIATTLVFILIWDSIYNNLPCRKQYLVM